MGENNSDLVQTIINNIGENKELIKDFMPIINNLSNTYKVVDALAILNNSKEFNNFVKKYKEQNHGANPDSSLVAEQLLQDVNNPKLIKDIKNAPTHARENEKATELTTKLQQWKANWSQDKNENSNALIECADRIINANQKSPDIKNFSKAVGNLKTISTKYDEAKKQDKPLNVDKLIKNNITKGLANPIWKNIIGKIEKGFGTILEKANINFGKTLKDVAQKHNAWGSEIKKGDQPIKPQKIR